MRRALVSSLLASAALALCARPARATPNFNTKEGVVLSSAVMQAATGAYPALRVYYIRGSSLVYSAVTADGLSLAEDPGVRLSSLTVPSLDVAVSSITGLSILPLTGGGFRMLYSVIGTTGAFRIYSATSADGLAWANDAGPRVNVDNGLTFVQFPSLVKLTSGDWRLYYIQNSIFGNQPSNHQVFTARSIDQGLTWTGNAVAVAKQAGEVAAAELTNGAVRVCYTAAPAVGVATNTTIASALGNASGLAFVPEAGLRLSTGSGLGSLSTPFVARTTDTFRWRVYYNFLPFNATASTSNVNAAVTNLPDPQSILPAVAYRGQPPLSATISGEVFSPGASAQLSMAGQAPIPGTSVSVTNDQTMTAAFNTTSVALGQWDLTVTDASGQATTLPAALLVDFLGGSVAMKDNLLRPRQGTRTRVDVNVFSPGPGSVKVYTTDGRLVSTLFDGQLSQGTQSFFWDGTTSQGHTAASGVYLVRAKGPKLDAVNKVVLIK